MEILGLILFIVFLLGAIAIFVVGILNVLKSIKSKGEVISYKTLTKRLMYFSIAFGVSLATSLMFIYVWREIPAKWYEYIATSVGGTIFGLSLFITVHFFIFHYYGKDINQVLDKWLFRGLVFFFISALVFFFVTLDGFADHINLTMPLAHGINFSEGLAYPGNYGPDTNIAWYALCILGGALIVYFYCDHRMYQQYGKHGILESTFLLAFPAGVVGARIFYVIGEWNTQFASDPMSMFAIWDGGLTILGGAFTGIVVGVSWFMWRNKGYNIFVVADIVLPSILIAQAVGRWGNFFNAEVHGLPMDGEFWSWLPKIIYNNIRFGHDGLTTLAPGQVFVPLFLIEAAINMLGFILLAFVIGKKLRKFTAFGDVALGYFIWYGLVRALLEPLRDSQYIMNSFWSWFWSLAFIIVGVIGIIVNHTIRNLVDAKKGNLHPKENWFKTGIISSSIFAAFGIAFVVGSILMITTTPQVLAVGISSYQFLAGLTMLAVGVGVLGFLAISIPYTLRGHSEIKRTHA